MDDGLEFDELSFNERMALVQESVNKDDFNKGLFLLEKARTISPHDPSVYNNLGVLYYKKKEYEKAKGHFSRSIELDGNYCDPHYSLACLYLKEVNNKKAEQFFHKCLEINPYHIKAKEHIERLAAGVEKNTKEKSVQFESRENGKKLNNTDPFLKLIPEEVHTKKTGYNICVICDYNIAGLLTGLMRGINKYSQHKARCIIWHDDHFSYDKDIILDECGEDYSEVVDIINKTDFFHFGRYIFDIPGVDFKKLFTPRNCVVEYYGSFLRKNGSRINEWHKKTGIPAIAGTDFSITSLLDTSYYHINQYIIRFGDMEEEAIPKAEFPKDVIRIAAGSAGSPRKRYDLLQKAIIELQKKGFPVELEIIKGVTNEECLKLKQKCHITFTSLSGGWGISGIESMYLGHPVLSCIDPFILSMYPNQPAVIINEENLYNEIESLVKSPEKIKEIGDYSRQFALANFKVKDIIKKYMYLHDLIMNCDYYKHGAKSAINIYNW